jgi:hypothetical protein
MGGAEPKSAAYIPPMGGANPIGGREACTLRPAARVVVSIGFVESLPQSESVVA